MFHVLMSSGGPVLPADISIVIGLTVMSLPFLLVGLIAGWFCHYSTDVGAGRATGAGGLSGMACGLMTFALLFGLDVSSWVVSVAVGTVVSVFSAWFACWMSARTNRRKRVNVADLPEVG